MDSVMHIMGAFVFYLFIAWAWQIRDMPDLDFWSVAMWTTLHCWALLMFVLACVNFFLQERIKWLKVRLVELKQREN